MCPIQKYYICVQHSRYIQFYCKLDMRSSVLKFGHFSKLLRLFFVIPQPLLCNPLWCHDPLVYCIWSYSREC